MHKYIALILFPVFLFSFAQSFVLGDKELFLSKTTIKLNLIANELAKKTNTFLYISINNKSNAKDIKTHIKNISDNINGFYEKKSILISLALDIKKIDILSSYDTKNIFNKDDILDDYIIPFLIGYDKNSITSKYSAGALNGYSQVAELVAKEQNIILENAIYSGSKDTFDIFRYLIYFMFFVIFVIFVILKIRK